MMDHGPKCESSNDKASRRNKKKSENVFITLGQAKRSLFFFHEIPKGLTLKGNNLIDWTLSELKFSACQKTVKK